MIEKFTPDEIAQIKKELDITDKALASKSFLLSDYKSRIMKAMKGNKRKKAGQEVWNACLMLCDEVLQNYQNMGGHVGCAGRGELYHRYAIIFDLDQYKLMIEELVCLVEKWSELEREKK